MKLSRRLPRSFPAVLFLLCLVSFGLLIPWLGFYFDDWPVILMTRLQGAEGFIRFYQYDRPFSAWTYLLTAPLLGVSPLPWQLFSLLLRWMVALLMWACLRSLWPDHSRATAWMALLFAVYPAFDQQPISVAYSQHWITFALYFISLASMIASVRRPRLYWPLTLLGMFTCAIHLLTMEYFLGLELLRPVVLWLLLSEVQGSARRRLTLARWLPYLLILAGFVIWRLFFLHLAGEDPNRPELLYTLLSQPLAGLLQLLQLALQDIINILFGAWYRTVEPTRIILSDRFVLLSVLVAALTGAAVALYAIRRLGDLPQAEVPGRSWVRQALLFGLLALLLGPLPVWATNRLSLHGLYGGRFTLAATFGASILWVALLEAFSGRLRAKALLIGVMVGLAAGFHLQRANEFRWSWEDQTRFYWQLSWRAPSLQPETVLLSDGEIFLYVGRYSTATALNLLYPPPADRTRLAYWFAELYPGFMKHPEQASQGKDMQAEFRSFTFTGSTADSLVIFYEPEGGRCLWVLSPQDTDNPELPLTTRDALPLSNLDRIAAGPPAAGYPPTAIFGREPEHGWCYYFQKGSLAAQLGDWQAAARLGDEAQARGHSPNNPQEWLPFIEAYARTGRWDEAVKWTRHVYRINRDLAPRLCHAWDRILASAAPPPAAASTIEQMLSSYKCDTLEEP